MRINNKYKVGQSVYFIYSNRRQTGNIESIEITVSKNFVSIKYLLQSRWCNFKNYYDRLFDEDNIFPSVEELKKAI